VLWRGEDEVDELVVFVPEMALLGDGKLGSRLHAKFVEVEQGGAEARSRHALGCSRLACDTRQSMGINVYCTDISITLHDM
jgi:hypothetical protein